MKKIPRWLPGAIISLVLIAAILKWVDLRAMAEAIRKADYHDLAVAFALSFLWMMVRARVWQTLLRHRVSYGNVLLTTGEGYLLNNFLPFRLGEVGRAFLITRKSTPSADSGERLPFGEVLPTIVIERVVDLGISAAILLASLPYVVGAKGAERIGYVVGGGVAIGLMALYALARSQRRTLDLFHRLSARWPALQKMGGGFLQAFLAGLGVLTEGWLFARFLCWMMLNWGMALVAYYLMMSAYFQQARPVWSLFGLGAAAFGGAIPSLPGAVGTFDGALAGALTLLTGDPSTALAVALTARLYNYLNSGLIGGLGLAREGETLGEIYRQILQLKGE